MPLTIKKEGGKFIVTDPSGKKFGTHDTKQGAVNQIGAIESEKRRRHKSGLDLAAADKIRILAAELEPAHGTEQPPIMIMSDGTVEGTHLLLHGQLVPFKRMEIYCSDDKDYPSCSLSITVADVGPDGLEVEKTLRLRKEPQPEPAMSAKKKLDPNAKVRNRGDAVFPSTHSKVKDNKDHFPINDADQARNALSRVAQYSAAPKWWAGSLKSLQSAVRSAVKRKFKKINVTEANCKEGFALFYTTGSFRWAREN